MESNVPIGALIAKLSDHFGADEVRKLCHFFNLTPAKQSEVLEAKSPGLMFLEHLEREDFIRPGDATELEKALKELGIADPALTKIDEFHKKVGVTKEEVHYELDSDTDSEDSDGDGNSRQSDTFEGFLTKVGLDGKLSNKLGLDDFVLITDPSSSTSMTYPRMFWQKLTSRDYRACLPDPSAKDRFSVRDFIYAMLQCSDNFLRQDIITKMSSCQIAVPALLPDASTDKVKFLIWALRGIVKQRGTDLEQYIVYYPAFTVSVLRIGNVRLSKSHFLNTLTSRFQGKAAHPHFLSANDDCVTPSFSQGCLEVMWYIPTNTKNEILTEVTTFLNLRGDCVEHEPQATFACRAANLVIAFVAKENIPKYNEIFGKIKSWAEQVMFVPIREEDASSPDKEAKKIKRKGKSWYFVNTLQLDVLCNFISKEVAERCTKSAQSERRSLLDNISFCTALNIEVDQEEKPCQEVETVLGEVVRNMRGENLCEFKQSTFLLLRSWLEWVEIDKKPPAIEFDNGQSLEHLKEKRAHEKQVIREKQLEVGLSEHMKLFKGALMKFFHNKESHKDTLRYFMFSFQQILKRETDKGVNIHVQNIIKLREKLQTIGHTLLATKTLNVDASVTKERTKEMNLSRMLKLSCQKERELYRQKNLGCEHFIRELGQYYEAIMECLNSPIVDADAMILPGLAAYLLHQGMALEIMDGDTGRVPVTWVNEVLRELMELLDDELIFVLGIIGVQSSGKSTLLNSMFGVSFPVRAGRCTCGIFLRVLEVATDFSQKLGFRYVFLVDSEGLCSPERAQDNVLEQQFDNQLATFVLSITDITILNFEGENISPNMSGILQIATYAHMRMKKCKLKTQCRITQQKVGQPDAPLRNKANLAQIMATLDNATLAASQAEGFGDLYKEFSDVFFLHLDDKSQYIPPLWNGPMVPPNHLYSEAVVTLKNTILEDFIGNALQPQFRVSDFMLRIGDAWEAVKEETFVFSFQDSFKAIAYNELKLKYTMLIAEMRLHMISQRQIWQRLIEDSTEYLPEVHDKIKEEVITEFQEQQNSIVQSLKVHIETSSKENVLKLFREAFLNYAKLEVREAEMNMLLAIQNDIKKKEKEGIIQAKISEWRRELQEKALTLKKGDSKYSVSELQKLFDAQWTQWIKSVRDKLDLETARGSTIEKIFLEKLLKITSGMAVEKEISSLLKEEGGFDKHKGSILWSKLFPEQFSSTEDRYGKGEIISDVVSQVLFELKEQCKSRINIDENLVQFTLQNALLKLSSFESDSSLKTEDLVFTGDVLKLPNAIVAKALLHISGEACTIMQENRQKDEKGLSCNRLFEEHMGSLKNDFVAFYESKFQDDRAVSFVCDDLLRNTITYMKRLLTTLLGEILLNWLKPLHKCELLTQILCAIFTKEDAKNYLNFIDNPNLSIESWLLEISKKYFLQEETIRQVKGFIENKVDERAAGILSALRISSSKTYKQNADAVNEWINVFEKELKQKIGVQCCFPNLGQFKVSSTKEFADRITEFIESEFKISVLEKLQRPVSGDFEGVENFLTSVVVVDLVKEVAPLFIGCRKRCPLCGSPCDQVPVPFHKHSAAVHYPLGLSGKRNSNSSRLVVDFCSNSLLNQHFSYKTPGNEDIIGTANFEKEHPDWHINPAGNTYQNDYWKWVFAKYNHDFARHYNCKPANLPKSWTTVTKDIALKSLEYEKSVVIRSQKRDFGSKSSRSIGPTFQKSGVRKPKKGSGRRR